MSGNRNQQAKEGEREGERERKRGNYREREREGEREKREAVVFKFLETEVLFFISMAFGRAAFSEWKETPNSN